MNRHFLIIFLLTGCAVKQNFTSPKSINYAYLQEIEAPLCKYESPKLIVECLIFYREALKQSNLDKRLFLQSLTEKNKNK
ncbi:MAG: hypothetical protein LBG48_00295 [Rickettsiales bacterium]|nr:hypothetical protein [Rickettsiales bacterium]